MIELVKKSLLTQAMEDTEKSKNYEMTINASKYKDLRYFVKKSIFFSNIM